ncbi:hypothetical protein [Ornithinimicrobium kibberense]|uniref:hypothetical protein n=1 Tax=Ornithinimicrobium kibberense TaxID=282060 RepID=UPI00360EC81F
MQLQRRDRLLAPHVDRQDVGGSLRIFHRDHLRRAGGPTAGNGVEELAIVRVEVEVDISGIDLLPVGREPEHVDTFRDLEGLVAVLEGRAALHRHVCCSRGQESAHTRVQGSSEACRHGQVGGPVRSGASDLDRCGDTDRTNSDRAADLADDRVARDPGERTEGVLL